MSDSGQTWDGKQIGPYRSMSKKPNEQAVVVVLKVPEGMLDSSNDPGEYPIEVALIENVAEGIRQAQPKIPVYARLADSASLLTREEAVEKMAEAIQDEWNRSWPMDRMAALGANRVSTAAWDALFGEEKTGD